MGYEKALFLSGRCDVILIEQLDDVALDTNPIQAEEIKGKLRDKNVQVLAQSKIEKIEEKNVLIIHRDWQKSSVKTDCVVLAFGCKPEKTLAQELLNREIDFFEIGDFVKPRSLQASIRRAWDVTRSL